tara:strand:+ start:5117 stop:5545 length:429 start_codon:yes stop_codon:yes gene_type:complete
MNIYEFISDHLILTSGLILSLLLLIFNELKVKQQNIANIDPFKAVNLMNAGAKVIDIRSPEVYKAGHIVNSKNMSLDQLNGNQKKLNKIKNRSTIIICDNGVASSKAVNSLRTSGQDNIYGISGGIAGWTEANMPLITKHKK